MGEAFQLARSPRLVFGEGKIKLLPSLVKPYGQRLLFVTGKRSFASSAYSEAILNSLQEDGFELQTYSVDGEPSPATVDRAVTSFSSWQPQVVVSIGGGSVLDAGKAISAMLTTNGSVRDFLEGVGSKSHSGSKIPFIAVPTTAGTGSESTKNAVLAETGLNGFKKSLRHDNFVPDLALLDPALTLTCPRNVTAASGMDAFTQLLESFLSTSSNAFTDALALEGLRRVARSLMPVYKDGTNVTARTDMAMAAYLSGITLANAGLGAVHGLAGTIGGMYNVPHGVICSSLMPSANQVTLRKLRTSGDPTGALAKYAQVGEIFSRNNGKSADFYSDFLVDLMREWKSYMRIATLSECGISAIALREIATHSDSKNNPIALGSDDLEEIMTLAM